MKIDYLLLAGGRLPQSSYLKKLQTVAKEVVSIDHGAVGALKIKRTPSLHVGDGDSFSSQQLLILKPKKLVKLPVDKSISDLEYALKLLPSKKLKVVAGGHEDRDNRPDHGFANLTLLKHFKNIILVSETHWIVGLTKKPFRFSAPKNTLFSVVSLKGKGLFTIKGAQYNLKKESLSSPTHGLGNFTVKPWVTIKAPGHSLLFVQAELMDCCIKY